MCGIPCILTYRQYGAFTSLIDTLQAFKGPSLLDGDFNEDDSHASFADALSSWRGKAPAQAPAATGPNAAPGTCTYD